jgi:hypothetical protein
MTTRYPGKCRPESMAAPGGSQPVTTPPALTAGAPGRVGGRILALAGASVLLARRGDNAGISTYVKLRNAVACGDSRTMLNVQLAAQFARLCTRILHSYAPGNGASV